MTALTLATRPGFRVKLWRELRERQTMLAGYGLGLLGLTLVTILLQPLDPRSIDGVNIWVKPTKFLASIGTFALTSAWFFGYVRPECRRTAVLRGTVAMLILAGSLELIWIAWQASQGRASHFNLATPFETIMYGLMGLFAVLLVGTTLPLAWEIARRPRIGLAHDFVASVAIGLVLTFVLSTALGGYMSAQMNHAVGPDGGRVPLVGWNRAGGDLRVAHFLSIHAQQAIPLLGAALGITGLPPRARMGWLLLGAGLFAAVTVGVFLQAVAGRPLFPA